MKQSKYNYECTEPIILAPKSKEFKAAAEEFWANKEKEKKQKIAYYWNTFGR